MNKPNITKLLKLLDPARGYGIILQAHGDKILASDFYGMYALDPTWLDQRFPIRPEGDEVVLYNGYEGQPSLKANTLGKLWDDTWAASAAFLELTRIRFFTHDYEQHIESARVFTHADAPRKAPVLVNENYVDPVLAAAGLERIRPIGATFLINPKAKHSPVCIQYGGSEQLAIIMPMVLPMEQHAKALQQTIKLVQR